MRTATVPHALHRSDWISRFVTAVAALLCAAITHATPDILPAGTHVRFDKVYANNPALSQWIEGEITGYMAAQNYYKIRSTNGTNYTIANDPRWIRTAVVSSTANAPQQATTNGPAQAGSSQTVVPVGERTPGTRVQFDRVEALTPANGRWDSGVIVERSANNRYKIRGDNGTTYTIRDDPRWILPAGATPPGPRHDYLDHPQTAPGGNANNPVQAQAANAGAMPPDGLYNVTNLGALHHVGDLEIRGATYRGLEASGPFKPLGGNGAALIFTGGLAGLEDVRITGANYMGLSKIGQPVIKIRYVSASGFNEELEATKER